MFDNKIYSAPVGARTICEVDPEFARTRQGNSWNTRLMYGTVHGNFGENLIFGSLKELTDHLQTNAVIASPLAKG